ncbi:biosynthetic-type acetolactate synthase large subunit [Geosporobacter ferrireducens]|uniref:Acetolactate synthase n=1 Tax=Geosporobacter ferrireducens TaxID=1424294 RepID=A0A1D8GKS2_9FIRM|nr:biosynthetic-type acetolactate synthase large subunit [Geosporobacter ferrireducens]AOT71518.1 acetolactate synthase, large subunit, biosynthetic type [Geosporobacter ferrireducens]MTI57833.1 biosynthetic-type acetolactate synthase large subunit [Geosporobacter ferrireducens]
MKVTGARLLVEALKKENVEVVFGYPGGYIIPAFDELYGEESIELILPRHEQGLIHAADGYARSTGRVGVCLVTSGPGATNTITGLATANFDSVPIVCFTGQVPLKLIGKSAFQEADVVELTKSVCKRNYIVNDRKDLGYIIKEAFYIASTGRPGPVVVDLSVDILKAMGDDYYPETTNVSGYCPLIKGDPRQIAMVAEKLSKASKPLLLAGGGLHVSNGCDIFREFAEKIGAPVVSSLLGKGTIPGDHPLYIGMVGMHGVYAANKAITDCDLLFTIGTRLNDRMTGNLDYFAPNAEIIHIDIDPTNIGKNVPVEISIVGDAKAILEQLLPLVRKVDIIHWIKEIKTWEKEHSLKVIPGKERLSPTEVIQCMNEQFPEAITTTDVGQHQMWTSQFYRIYKTRTFLSSGGLGTMGYGLPAAIGAQIGNREKRVLVISGDGGLQMNIQELAIAVQQELPLIIAVINNNFLGMVRQWQGLFHDRKYSGTCLKKTITCPKMCNTPSENCPSYTPDFVKLAEAYGAIGIRVSKQEEILPALKKAKASLKTPVLIDFLVEYEADVLPMVPSGSPLDKMLLTEEMK